MLGYWFDGGKFSEGESASPFMFFAARHTEPWKAGRVGQPESNALFGGSNPDPDVLHRLYQWVDLKALQTRMAQLTTYELYMQASVKIRSLWVDRNQESKVSDQGRIALEFYKADVFSGDRSVQRDKSKYLARGQTEWYPPRGQVVTDAQAKAEIKRKRNWKTCTLAWQKVPAGTTGALVMLEGLHQSAWDTDAYFDDVMVHYEIRKTSV